MADAANSKLAAVLLAPGPSAANAEKLNLYGGFVGDWATDIVVHTMDGRQFKSEGEIHFDWVLEGRAIQDVWMIPKSRDRHSGIAPLPIAGNWYGTTLRVYDAAIDAWRIFWIDPATNSFRQQIGRQAGADIVQEGIAENDALSRWSFVAITGQSFDWRAEVSGDEGASWRLVVEVFARRVSD